MANFAQSVCGVGQYPTLTPLLRCMVEQALTVAANATTDFIVPIPVGARITGFRTLTDVAFGAVTDAQISIGKTVGGAEYVAATTIKAIGSKIHSVVDAAAADYESLPQAFVNVRITQSGGNSATGAAKLYVEYATAG